MCTKQEVIEVVKNLVPKAIKEHEKRIIKIHEKDLKDLEKRLLSHDDEIYHKLSMLVHTSSPETKSRFENLERRFNSFLETFNEHMTTKEKQTAQLVEMVGVLNEKLSGHISDEASTLTEMKALIEDMHPIQKKINDEATYYRIKKEKEEEEVKSIERKKTKYGVFFWIVSGILSVIGLFEVIRHLFDK